jgi:glucokinase
VTEPTIAIDLGGTHVRAALVASDGTIVAGNRRRTPSDEPDPSVIPRMIAEILSGYDGEPSGEAGEAGSCRPTKAVIGMPGIIDHEAEQLLHAPNLPPSWVDHLNEDWLRSSTGLEVSLANDADLAAVGESTFGAGRNYRDVAYVTVSTGVGAGVVVADRLVRGTLSGGELGHTIIDRQALTDGRPATVEDLGSGSALERAAAEAGLAERGQELADLVRGGDPVATEVWHRAVEAVGLGVANLAWMVAPEVVVVGGGVGMNGDLVNPILERCLADHGPVTGSTIDVVTASLGDGAALSGAAAWWKAVGRG